ncbi:hypothetical protein [Enterobacter hormaechei]|uniref:hypothetical protein n=1 Tax=Enterobacter cloacae complex TaxID=354276 RepID=UPI00079C58A4|nr:hypothetical protein [Enterobacter hormaechei]CZY06084.1 Uncharacterised protein [Enterobacter hormaechei]
MSPDAILLAKAIVSLQPSSDYMKDYIFPITLAFFSALLGGMSAIYINRKQDLKNITKDNFVAANETFVKAHGCLNNLIAIKANYKHITFDEPLYRALAYPTMLVKKDEVIFNPSTLYFIRPIPTANKPFPQNLIWHIKHRILNMEVPSPPPEELLYTWRNVVRISSMFGNYNQIMEFLVTRNELSQLAKEKARELGDMSEQQTLLELPKHLGRPLCGGLIDVTEQAIALTDHVIIELHKFMMEFPAIASSNIELKRIREWGGLPTYTNQQPLFLETIKPMAKPNFERLGAYVGISEDEARTRYTYRDWEKPAE